MKAKNDNSNEVSLSEIFGKLRNHIFSYWLIYTLFSIFGFIGAKTYLRYVKPVYLVQATLLIKNDNSSIGSSGDKGGSFLSLFGPEKNIDDELEIIKSRQIIKDAIIKSNAQVEIFKKTRIKDVPVSDKFPFKIIPVHADNISWPKSVILKFNTLKNVYYLNNVEYAIKDSNLIVYNLIDTLQILCNKKELGKLKKDDYLINISSLNNFISKTKQNFEVKPNEGSQSIMELSLKTNEISSGTLLLNNIISTYSESEFINKNITNKYTLNFIHDRLAIVSKELDEVEQNLENFKKKNEITDISQQSVLYLSSIQEQDKDLTKVVLQLAVIDEAEKYLKEKGNRLGAAPSLLGVEDPILLQMFTTLNTAEIEYAHKIQIAGEKDDAVLTLKRQIDQLKQSIHESLYNLKFNLQTTQNQLLNDINSQNKFLHSIPTKERELVNISRQQALKNSLYNFLLEKREESELSSASTVSNSRLIESTYSTGYPISPKPLNIYLIGVFISLLFPFLYLFVRENLKTTIQQKSEIDKMTTFPVIGQILIDNDHKDFVIAENSRSNLAESFRATRTKLSYYINFEDKKVILISSSVPGEGKTFFSLNIGRSYSLTGKKTLLISADMRKPTLHKIFNLSIKKGLSNFLINMASIDEIIYNTGIENLSIIPVGPLPPNPSELLTSPKLKELLDSLRNLYDVIIIDTPPLGLISDSELIAPLVNACVFLTRQNHTPKDMFEKVVMELEESSAFKNISIVFNGIKIPISSYSNKYGYGYMYGLDEQAKIPFHIRLLNLININK